MTTYLEPTGIDDFIKGENEDMHSRSKETLDLGQNLLIATVVSKITLTVPTTGTLGSGTKGECVSVTGGAYTELGTYKATCTTANAGAIAGVWRIEAPNGDVLGDLTVTAGVLGTGSFTDPQINLTINYLTDYNTVGDYFNITVTAGSNELTVYNYSGVDGSNHAYGIMADDCDATNEAKDCTAFVRDAHLAKSGLVWKLTFTSGGTNEPKVGDTLEGIVTTTASCRILAITVSSGTWAGGDAAGYMFVDRLTADLTAEYMRIVGADPTSSEYFTTATDRTFTGGATNWANGDIGTTFDETTDLTLVADATGQYCGISFTNIGTALVSGYRYRLQYDYTETTAGFEFKLNGAALQTLGDAVPGTNNFIDFTADEVYATTDELRIYSKTNAAASGSFDNFSLKCFDDLTAAATYSAYALEDLAAANMALLEEA